MIRKIKRGNLSDQVSEGLLSFIDEQELLPGDSLPSESQLAEEFGVSRPVIREALKILQGEGLVEIVTGKNAIIRPVSSALLRKFFERAIAFKTASFRHLIEVRRGLEVQSVMLAAERRTDDDIAAMRTALDLMRDNLKTHDVFAVHDVSFHLHIASATHNPMIYHLVESIRDAMHDNVILGLQYRFTDDDYELVQESHEMILQAVINQDAQQAQASMNAHFEEALDALLYSKD